MLASLQRRANEHLRISDDRDVEGLLKFFLDLHFLVYLSTFVDLNV